MHISKAWPSVVTVLVLAAPVAGQEALDLDTYVKVVLRSHPLVAEGQAAAKVSAAEERSAGALPDPVVGVSRSRATPVPGGFSGIEWGFSVSQTLPWPGARNARIRTAVVSGRSRLLEEEAARWDLELDARLAFGRLAQSRRSLAQAEHGEADAVSVLEITTRRADVGEVREADRSRAQAERLRMGMALRMARRESEAAEAALRALSMEPLPEPLLLHEEPAARLSQEEIDRRRAKLATQSPGLRLTQAAIDREMAVSEAARAGRFPDLDLSATRVKELDKEAWSLAANVRVPLWNANRAEIARAEASASLERSTLTRRTLESRLAFDAAVQQAQSVEDRLQFLSSTLVPTAHRTFDLVRLSYEEGETSLLDLLEAQRTLREAEIEEGVARFDAVKAWIEVERISGPRAATEKAQ